MPSLLTFKYGDWYLDELGNKVPAPSCDICTPLAERIYPPGEAPQLPAHPPDYHGDPQHVYSCGCYYQQVNMTDQADDPNHTHADLVQAIHDLSITELQKHLLDLAAAVQAAADSIGPPP